MSRRFQGDFTAQEPRINRELSKTGRKTDSLFSKIKTILVTGNTKRSTIGELSAFVNGDQGLLFVEINKRKYSVGIGELTDSLYTTDGFDLRVIDGGSFT